MVRATIATKPKFGFKSASILFGDEKITDKIKEKTKKTMNPSRCFLTKITRFVLKNSMVEIENKSRATRDKR